MLLNYYWWRHATRLRSPAKPQPPRLPFNQCSRALSIECSLFQSMQPCTRFQSNASELRSNSTFNQCLRITVIQRDTLDPFRWRPASSFNQCSRLGALSKQYQCFRIPLLTNASEFNAILISSLNKLYNTSKTSMHI